MSNGSPWKRVLNAITSLDFMPQDNMSPSVAPDLLDQKPGGWGTVICVLTVPPGDSNPP